MRILVATDFPETALDELRGLGCDVDYKPRLASDELPRALPGFTGLVVGRTVVSADAIAAGTSLQLIVRAGTDVSSIAVDEAAAQGIFVAHTPHRDAVAVAEMMIALMLALDRNLLDAAAGRSGAAPAPGGAPRSSARPTGGDDPPMARGLARRALGILGFGPVGRELAVRARGLRMTVFAWDAALASSATRDPDVAFCNWPRDVSQRSDIVCVDGSASRADDGLLSDDVLQNLRDGAYLVYVGPHSSIDETAVAEAVRTRHLRAAFDFTTTHAGRESSRIRSHLAELPGVLVTYGLANRTQQARESIATEVVQIVREFLIAGNVRNCVNLMERSPATWLLALRLRDAVGVMAAIMEAIRSDGINAEEITTRVFTGARAAWCTIALDERPSAEAVEAIRNINGVLHLELRAVV